MKMFGIASVVLAFAALVSCSSVKGSVLPLRAVEPKAEVTLIWKGHGDAFLFKDGAYVRSESNDYDFAVVQNRFGDHWESEKIRHYLSPAYDGSAGARDQFMYFGARYKVDAATVKSTLESSLGLGSGETDKEFRQAHFVIVVENGGFTPFNRFRITQDYRYEEGRLEELVELYLEKDGKVTPFMKIEEHALMFGQRTFDKAPSSLN